MQRAPARRARRLSSVSAKAVYEIARVEQRHDPALAEISLESLARSIVASARSMGIRVEGGSGMQ